MKIKKIIFILLLLIILFPIYNSNAQWEANGQGSSNSNLRNFSSRAGLSTNTSLYMEILKYIDIILSFLGIIFLVLIIISGVRWMTSGGNETIIDKARANLKSSVIGLLIILGSWVIANGIVQIIVHGKGATPQEQGIYDSSFYN